MNAWIIAALCWLFPDTGAWLLKVDAQAKITLEDATEHVWSAWLAGHVARVDPNELLALASHETHFERRHVEHDAWGLGCGVLTPTPVATCKPAPLVDQYLDGAWHLRGWYDAVGGYRTPALLGVAGGYYLIRWCTEHEAGCTFPRDLAVIEDRVRKARQ